MKRIAILIAAAILCLAAAGCDRGRTSRAGGDPAHGRLALLKYGCTSCHSIPGIQQSDLWVGPPLDRYSHRPSVAGTLPNTPENLMLFILDPASVRPGTTMPDAGLTEDEARDIAAYLYSR